MKKKILIAAFTAILLCLAMNVALTMAAECPDCHGTGEIECPYCDGTGEVVADGSRPSRRRTARGRARGGDRRGWNRLADQGVAAPLGPPAARVIIQTQSKAS